MPPIKVFLIVTVVALGICWAVNQWRKAVERRWEAEAREEEQGLLHDHGTVNYSNPRNNHDHLKCKYATREEAESMVRRMKRANCDGSERLNVYYNRELEGWYVGKGWE